MLYLPETLPAVAALKSAGMAVSEYSLDHYPKTCHDLPAASQGEKPLRILFLNIMPQKAVTEMDIARTLSATGHSVCLLPMKIAGQTYKTTPQDYVERYYRDFEYYAEGQFDGLIVTGAPVEHLDFEQVRYWPQLCAIMDWAATHVNSALYICWGAQAALYHLHGIPKYPLPEKKFGIYPQQTVSPQCPLLAELSPEFPMPQSRHTEVRAADFAGKSVDIVACGKESGVGLAMAHEGREVFIVGHLEYAADTLDREYHRDLDKGLPIHLPRHYYVDDQPEQGINYSWQTAAVRFYGNWLKTLRTERLSQ